MSDEELIEALRSRAEPLAARQAEFVEHLLAIPADHEGLEAAVTMERAADRLKALTQPSGKVSDEMMERSHEAFRTHPRTAYDVPSEIIRSVLEAAQLPARPVVKALDDDQIMEIIREVAPWQSEAALNDLLTYEKSVPLFPQATYDVPSYRAEKFVRAVERRILSALEGEGE